METQQFIYEKAIERYNKFEMKYKEWMYLYAIFVGALLVAFYRHEIGNNEIISIISKKRDKKSKHKGWLLSDVTPMHNLLEKENNFIVEPPKNNSK
jgi:hypothetical protein